MATKNGITGNPSRIIIDFNKYIALTAFEIPTYQYYGYHTYTYIYIIGMNHYHHPHGQK